MTAAQALWIASGLMAIWFVIRAINLRQSHLTSVLKTHVEKLQAKQKAEREARIAKKESKRAGQA
ncbi:MAG: hypothetical protein AAF539_07705 [Planctomycetota bacterium]